ncbi:glycerol-3-phosphate dehydrogenase [Sediminibacterium roseum]|uniref:Glycerol-3-phosphate dehydrogenase n=1 Tax=Sediminibacterium roseum TaxID=1978412 RepID=A0ABW9ZUN0_9BACT|nr:RebB family R body protein [Sediminibacterium roseum]NCI49452.1 glycerol-3-phosphate dehydrogenase [Sediminibacterium roseum]
MPSSVNDQITDSITEVNTETIGNSAGVAMGNLYQAVSQALGLAAYNATEAQQQGNILGQAVTSKGVQMILTIPAGA